MDVYERCASAAFEWDRKNGHHHGGRWTWHTIPEEGRENYRAMVKAVLAEANFEGAVSAGVAEVVAWIRREYAEDRADATFSYYGLALADDIERHFGGR